MPRTTTGMLHVPLNPPPPPFTPASLRRLMLLVSDSALPLCKIVTPAFIIPSSIPVFREAPSITPERRAFRCICPFPVLAQLTICIVGMLGCASFDYRGAWDLCETPCSFLVSDETAGGMTPILVAITPPPLKKVHKKILA